MQQEMVRGQESTFNSSQIFVKTGLLDRTITHVFCNLNVILVYRLYNKDAVIEFLLDKSADRPNSEVVSHLRGIKDIKELNLTDNPAWEGERRNTKGDRYEDMHCAMFICPVVGLEMNGKHRFCFLRTCGCVFSDRALKEVKTEICHKVGQDYVASSPTSYLLFCSWLTFKFYCTVSSKLSPNNAVTNIYSTHEE
ncbi:unnamed protein product [Oncorhynchus mykiss]|uniref:Replication termination factor 2 n=1 Tax=Oncorhynchus mykiss TaxID=8022 RepID=A0A060XTW2_ONCMY|nr:unnamed protein product [Oncorhynchus mykiss]